MKNIISALVSLTLFSSLLVGCGNAVDTAPAKATASDVCARDGRAGDHEYVFSAGSAQVARVVRSMRDDGSEKLTGFSKLSRGTLTEYAEMGADGRLTYADVSYVGENGAQRRVLVDAAHGAFYVQDAQGASWHRMPKDVPWVLTGLTDEDGAFMLDRTPVSAWIAARAAKASPSLRIIDAKLRHSVVAAADQYVVERDAAERLVVTGSSVISVNEEFITSLGDDASTNPMRVAIASLRPRRTAQR
jgi:hypothetical protein